MGLAFGAAPLTSAAASRAPTAAMAKRPRAAGDVPSIHSFASVAPISLLTQDESRAPVPMDAPVSNAVVNLADSASPRATGDSDVEDVTAAVTASSASAAIPRASSLAAAGTRAEHSTAPQPPRSRGGGAVTGAVAPGRSSHPHSLRQATLSNSAASDDRSRAALRDRDAVSATLRAAGFDAAFFWALPEEEQLSVLRQAQSKRARTATGIGAGMSGVAAAAAAAAAAAPPKTPAQIAPHPRAAAASSPRGPAAAVVLLLDDSQDVRVDVCDSPKQQVPVMQTDGATVAREDGDALAPSSTGLPPFSSSGGWMAGLRTWMLAIGPFPAPRDARALVDRAVECVMTHGAEHAATLLRCLRRHCAAIEAERVRMAAAPGAEPEAEEAYRRGGSVPGDATARGGGRATWADVEAAVAEAVDGAARESFGAAVLWD